MSSKVFDLFLRGAFCRCSVKVIISTLAAGVMNGQSLLNNSELTIADHDAKSVSGWQLTPASTELAAETTDLPAGVMSGLRVTVSEASTTSGALMQRLVIPSMSRKLTLTGYVRSSEPRGGYIEVKLYSGRKELSRTNGGVLSEQHWQKVTINIDPAFVDKQGVATQVDRMEVLCRWYRQEKHVGGTVSFAGLQLTETAGSLVGTGTAEGRRCGWGRRSGIFGPQGSLARFGSDEDWANSSIRGARLMAPHLILGGQTPNASPLLNLATVKQAL